MTKQTKQNPRIKLLTEACDIVAMSELQKIKAQQDALWKLAETHYGMHREELKELICNEWLADKIKFPQIGLGVKPTDKV